MNTGRLGATVLLCFMVLYIVHTSQRTERFEVQSANADIDYSNRGPEPWNHHEVSQSLPLDLVPKSNKPYYYEFDNAEYDVALKNTFQYPCSHAADVLKVADWTIVDVDADSPARSGVATAYDSVIDHVRERVNSSEYLELPYDNPHKRPSIQVVHDVLIQAKTHVRDMFKYVLYIELILYREAKFHGKHVSMTVVTTYDPSKKQWDFYVVEINVLGIVYEDQIGLFPVVASYNKQVDGVSFDTLSQNSPILPSKEVTSAVMDKQTRALSQNIATTKSIYNAPSPFS